MRLHQSSPRPRFPILVEMWKAASGFYGQGSWVQEVGPYCPPLWGPEEEQGPEGGRLLRAHLGVLTTC